MAIFRQFENYKQTAILRCHRGDIEGYSNSPLGSLVLQRNQSFQGVHLIDLPC